MKIKEILDNFHPKHLINAFDVQDFWKALAMTLGMVLPIVIGVLTGNLSAGIHVTLGVVFASFSDTAGSLRLKITGMALATLLTMVVTFAMHFLKLPLFVFLPILGLMIFTISYLSIYGFRASLISFSGLFAIVLSISSVSDSELDIWTRVILIGVGGLFYIFLTLFRYILFPKSATEYYIGEALRLTSDYLNIRAQLIDRNSDRKVLIKELLEKQQALTETHETLREILLSRRLVSGKSYYQARRSLIFRFTVDVLELAMANPVNYLKMDEVFDNHPGCLDGFQKSALAMSQRLKYISRHLSTPGKIKKDDRIPEILEHLKLDILSSVSETENPELEEGFLVLKNYWRYHRSQYLKIRKIEALFYNRNDLEIEMVRREDKSRFLTKQEYNLSTLKDNFNIHSSIFRHSLRIAIVGVVGYGIGTYFNIVNAYWILLTVIIIMRPNFGLTKERFKDRSLGTIIGGALAFLIIILVQNDTVYGILAIVCNVVGMSMVHRNYKAAASFITMYVLFVYALLNPEVFTYIQFRVIDTLIGAGLAFAGSWLLWPLWEIRSIDKTLKTAIEADRKYLEEIAKLYNEKGAVTNEYKLSRKAAFLALSELSASFQRMAQEPRAQHESLNEVFQIVMLMHSFLASLASLGTYIVSNKTTEASEDFNATVEAIKGNLLLCEEALDKVKLLQQDERITEHHFDEEYERRLQAIAQKGELTDDWERNTINEEAHLLVEQFKWLMANSHRMAKILKTIKFHA